MNIDVGLRVEFAWVAYRFV